VPRSGVFVLLPILNEADCIEELLTRLDSVLAPYPFLIGILDDGSTDGTVDRVECWMSAHPGKVHLIRSRKTASGCQRGAALNRLLRWGLENTPHSIFVEMDGDLSHLPEEIPEGLHRIENGADIVIASKYLSGSREVDRHLFRRIVSGINTRAATWLLDPSITDYSNGFRFYTRRAAQLLAASTIQNAGPVYLTEVLSFWLREDLRIEEFASLYVGRKTGASKVILSDVFRAGVAFLKIAARHRFPGPAGHSSAALPARRDLWATLPLAALVFLFLIHAACVRPHLAGIDEVSLYNPAYMLAHTGRIGYPAYGYPSGMFVHPPIKTGAVGELLIAGLSRHQAEAAVSLATLLPAVVCAAWLPLSVLIRIPLLAGLLAGVVYLGDVSHYRFAVQHEVGFSNFTMRPDIDVYGAWVLGLLLLERGRLTGWNRYWLAAGAFFLTLASGTHYYALPAMSGVLVYMVAAWRQLGPARASTPIKWLIAGAGAFGIPYLVFFVIPYWRQIASVIAGNRAVGGPIAAVRASISVYKEVFQDSAPFVTALTALPAHGIFLLPLAALPLAMARSTRLMLLAALPLPLFVHLGATHKQPEYFSHEIFLFAAASMFVFTTLVNRLLPGRPFVLAAVSLPAFLWILSGAGFAQLRDWTPPQFDEMEIARAAGKEMLGPDARVGYRLSFWYVGGEARRFLIDPDIHWQRNLRVDLDHYLPIFDAIAVNAHFSDQTNSLDGLSTSALFARGRLRLRGFFWAEQDFNFGYLLLAAKPPGPIVGYARRGGRLFRYEEDPSGSTTLISADCPEGAGESDLRQQARFWHFLLLPPGQGARRRIVSVLYDQPPALPAGCRELVRARGVLREQDTGELVRQLRATDQLVKFDQDFIEFAGPEREYDATRARVAKRHRR
jgi:dolichol-phosphate mannosyltransferase